MAKRAAGDNNKAGAQQKKTDELNRRRAQLEDCEALGLRAEAAHRAAIDANRRHGALTDHAHAFYVEIDKLAKKQPNMPVSDLAVESINDIIRDAKLLIQGDVHLERLKEFVPAGNNPSHADVLLKTKLVRSALSRGKDVLSNHITLQVVMASKARALAYVLRSIVEEDVTPPKEDVESEFGEHTFFNEWFDDEDDFDVTYLDKVGVAQFMTDGDADVPTDDEDAST